MSGEREKGVIFSSQFPDMLGREGERKKEGKDGGVGMRDRKLHLFWEFHQLKVESRESAN